MVHFESLEGYEAKKQKYISLGLEFEERISAKRRSLKCFNTVTYLEHSKDEFRLQMYEMGAINAVRHSVNRNLKNADPLPCYHFQTNYILCNNFSKSFSTDDIYEIDLDSAFLRATLRRGLISKKVYQMFQENETDPKEIERKMSLPLPHQKQYIKKSTGELLRYSKKSRLIALGSLAKKERIFKYEPQRTIIPRKQKKTKLSRIPTFKHIVSESKLSDEYVKENKETANVFFAAAYDIDRLLHRIIKEVEGVFFYWVDAVFCNADAIEKVIDIIECNNYDFKITKHNSLYFNKLDSKFILSSDNKKNKSYQFNKYKNIQNVTHYEDVKQDVINKINDYNFLRSKFKDCSNDYIAEQIGNKLDFTKKQILSRTEKGGYKNPLDYLLWLDCKRVLNIKRVGDYNLNYLLKELTKRGLSYEDFLKVFKQNIFDDKYKNTDLETIGKASFLVECLDSKKDYESEINEHKFNSIFGKGDSTKITSYHLPSELIFEDLEEQEKDFE